MAKHRRTRFIVPFAALLIVAACSEGKTDKSEEPQSSQASSESTPSADMSNVTVPDACTFISRAELEQAVGWQLGEGKPATQPPGSYECRFKMPPKLYIERTFPNPPLPESAGFYAITVYTNPIDEKSFAELRQEVGAEGEDVPGVGDAAYFNGPTILYVRKGNKGFSFRLYFEPTTDADRVKAKEVLISLAKLGVSRLG